MVYAPNNQKELADRLNRISQETTYYYHGIAETIGEEGPWGFEDRYWDFARHVTFEPQDVVLDVGCAEGLISMEVARKVQHVDAFELSQARVDAARKIAEQRQLTNVTFTQADAAALTVAPQSYDVVLFLGVFHHLPRQDKMGTLVRLMSAARRMFVMRTPLNQNRSPNRLTNIYTAIERLNFSVTIYPNLANLGGNLMVMHRA